MTVSDKGREREAGRENMIALENRNNGKRIVYVINNIFLLSLTDKCFYRGRPKSLCTKTYGSAKPLDHYCPLFTGRPKIAAVKTFRLF